MDSVINKGVAKELRILAGKLFAVKSFLGN
jgi:hypothetical protein